MSIYSKYRDRHLNALFVRVNKNVVVADLKKHKYRLYGIPTELN
mgnify:CR=1 FL=1